MATEYTFEGWIGKDASSAQGNLVWGEFRPKRWEETDVDIRVTHSAVCGSDIHTLSNGWVSPHSHTAYILPNSRANITLIRVAPSFRL